MNRRHFMTHMAGLSAMTVPGLTFLSNLKAQSETMKKNGKSLIVLWMSGGPTTLDLWDPKYGHPNGGAFKAMNTAASGVQVTEHLPNVAKQMKNLAIIRALKTTEGDHMRGSVLMNTGHSPSPLVEYPSIGSILAHQFSASEGDMPAFISIGGNRATPGFLGMKFAPLTIQNPGTPPENVEPPKDIAGDRMMRRASLFSGLEARFQGSTGIPTDAARAHRDVYDKALNLVTSSRKDVFKIDPVKDAAAVTEYGNNAFGRGCLMARKLVEAGTACVQVELGGWDMHANIFTALHSANPAMPGRLDTLDKGMGALVADLTKTGKIKDTAIVWMGEFGRTPRINQGGGRDHYPRCWSIVVGGGSIKGGQAYGSTDAGGEDVKENPARIGDVFATLFAALGLDPTTQIRDNLGRPLPIAGEGSKPIKELVG